MIHKYPYKVDFCTPATGLCTSTPNHLDCDNGLFCDGSEICDAVLGCQSGTAPSCSGSTPLCSEDLDQCIECLSDSDCDDGNACNELETCNASGQCIAGTPIDCDDEVACTVSVSISTYSYSLLFVGQMSLISFTVYVFNNGKL